MKMLSVLILSLPSRINRLASLVGELTRQINAGGLEDQVQVMVLTDSREMSVGDKRNKLMEMSSGKYVCYIDDDDSISENYLSKILEGCRSDVDVVTFCGIYRDAASQDVGDYYTFKISTLLKDSTVGRCFNRRPNHLCPVKREIAIKHKFPEKNYGEDFDYSELLNPSLTNEFHIIDQIYYYNFDMNVTQTHPNAKSTAFNEQK